MVSNGVKWFQMVLSGFSLVLSGSASGMERGEVFYGPTDWLGSHDSMTHYDYAPDSSSGLDD
jgi:hypothetical protein